MGLIVTGAAGFIGSNLVRALNARGITDIVAVDNLSRGDKVANLADLEIADFIDKRDFIDMLRGGLEGEFDAVLFERFAAGRELVFELECFPFGFDFKQLLAQRHRIRVRRRARGEQAHAAQAGQNATPGHETVP